MEAQAKTFILISPSNMRKLTIRDRISSKTASSKAKRKNLLDSQLNLKPAIKSKMLSNNLLIT